MNCQNLPSTPKNSFISLYLFMLLMWKGAGTWDMCPWVTGGVTAIRVVWWPRHMCGQWGPVYQIQIPPDSPVLTTTTILYNLSASAPWHDQVFSVLLSVYRNDGTAWICDGVCWSSKLWWEELILVTITISSQLLQASTIVDKSQVRISQEMMFLLKMVWFLKNLDRKCVRILDQFYFTSRSIFATVLSPVCLISQSVAVELLPSWERINVVFLIRTRECYLRLHRAWAE